MPTFSLLSAALLCICGICEARAWGPPPSSGGPGGAGADGGGAGNQAGQQGYGSDWQHPTAAAAAPEGQISPGVPGGQMSEFVSVQTNPFAFQQYTTELWTQYTTAEGPPSSVAAPPGLPSFYSTVRGPPSFASSSPVSPSQPSAPLSTATSSVSVAASSISPSVVSTPASASSSPSSTPITSPSPSPSSAPPTSTPSLTSTAVSPPASSSPSTAASSPASPSPSSAASSLLSAVSSPASSFQSSAVSSPASSSTLPATSSTPPATSSTPPATSSAATSSSTPSSTTSIDPSTSPSSTPSSSVTQSSQTSVSQAATSSPVTTAASELPTSVVAAPPSSMTAAAASPSSTAAASAPVYPAIPGLPPFPSGLSLDQCVAAADNVLPDWAGANFEFSGNVRTFYVSAEQVTWNYAPSGWDNWLGVPLNESARAWQSGYTNAQGSIGGAGGFEWQKAVYRGYTDATFTTPTERPPWLGLNGPILRAEVGDMLQVVFLNKLTANYMNMHSMGLGYDKTNDGSVYINNIGVNGMSAPGNDVANPGDAIPPGGCFTYKWLAGPSNNPAQGFHSHLWSYHPFVNMPSDLTTGLVGPVIIYSPGWMDRVMAENREFVLMYQGYLEIESWLAQENVQMYAPALLPALQAAVAGHAPPIPSNNDNITIWAPQLTNNPSVPLSIQQAPFWQALNGYIFGNMPPLELCEADQGLWYIMAFGQNSHSFHLHGNNFHVAGEQEDYYKAVQAMLPGEMYTLAMNGTRPGSWQVICHISGHMALGMQDLYVIYPDGSCPLPPLTSAGNSTIQ